MRHKIYIFLAICVLMFGLSFPAMSQAKGKKVPHGVPFHSLLKKINALSERVEELENQISVSYLTEIVVLAESITIGDHQPTWETTITIENNELKYAKYAAVEFVLVGVWDGTSDNLIVNGRKYVLPVCENVRDYAIPVRGKTVIPIPVGVLQEGDNTIGFESGPIANPNNLWDDFEFGDVVLVLSH